MEGEDRRRHRPWPFGCAVGCRLRYDDQLTGFFARIKSRRDKALFTQLRRSGVRASEALGLNTDNVDLRDRSFRVMGKGKTERLGYLARQTVKLLRQSLREREDPTSAPPV